MVTQSWPSALTSVPIGRTPGFAATTPPMTPPATPPHLLPTTPAHVLPTSPPMTLPLPPLLDDPDDLSALRANGADPDELFAAFADWAAANGTVLYPTQEEALIELVSGANVVLATPTGSGKSLVAIGVLCRTCCAGPVRCPPPGR
jgi:ATP-dependent helicase YprA (DUF1998 family)